MADLESFDCTLQCFGEADMFVRTAASLALLAVGGRRPRRPKVSDFRIVSIFPFGIPVCFHAVVLFWVGFFFTSKCTEDPDPVELLSAVH